MSQGAIVFVVNPRSANGATLRRFDRLRERFARELGVIEVRLTERPRHATELARDAIRAGARAVVAVGARASSTCRRRRFGRPDRRRGLAPARQP
mgnify:CR=1 FL=1